MCTCLIANMKKLQCPNPNNHQVARKLSDMIL